MCCGALFGSCLYCTLDVSESFQLRVPFVYLAFAVLLLQDVRCLPLVSADPISHTSVQAKAKVSVSGQINVNHTGGSLRRALTPELNSIVSVISRDAQGREGLSINERNGVCFFRTSFAKVAAFGDLQLNEG